MTALGSLLGRQPQKYRQIGQGAFMKLSLVELEQMSKVTARRAGSGQIRRR